MRHQKQPRFLLLVLLSLLAAVVSACASSDAGGEDTLVASTVTESDEATSTVVETTTTTAIEQTTTTVRPTTTAPSTTTTVAALGSLSKPIEVGVPVELGDWEIRVAGVTRDATELVLAENQFNDPPEDGRQFFMAILEATYIGDGSSNFWLDVALKAVGPSNVAYESFEASCGVVPDAIDDSGETFPGGSITGNVCWSVRNSDADALVMIAEPGFSFSDERAFMSLDPMAEPAEAPSNESASPENRLADAVPLGESAQVGAWELTVTEVISDATEIVLDENQFNDPPGEGEQFYLVSIKATYNGNDSSTFWIDMSLKSVGEASVAYEGFDGSCGVIPDNLNDAGETFPGGTVTGNVCWKVIRDDIGSLVMIAEETWTVNGERVLFSISETT